MGSIARLQFPGRSALFDALKPADQRIIARSSSGVLIELDLADPAERRMFYDEYDRPERTLLRALVSSSDVALDIGAHIGYFTLNLAQIVGDQGKVIAVEPSPSNAARLRRNVKLNDYHQVEIVEAAAAGHTGVCDFFVPDSSHETGAGPSFLGTTVRDVIDATEQSLAVQCVRVDDLTSQRGITHVKLVKLDAEGGELGALAGMERLLASERPPRLVCEISAVRLRTLGASTSAIHDYLDCRGYVGYRLEPEGLQRANSPTADDSNFESHLFLPANDPLLVGSPDMISMEELVHLERAI